MFHIGKRQTINDIVTTQSPWKKRRSRTSTLKPTLPATRLMNPVTHIDSVDGPQ